MTKNLSKKIKEFLYELDKCRGEKILIFRSGGFSNSSCIHREIFNFEETTILSKLNHPTYEIKEKRIFANTGEIYKFTSSTGWKKTQEPIELTSFAKDYSEKPKLTDIQKNILETTIRKILIEKNNNNSGFFMHYFQNKEENKKMVIERITYDSDPYCSLFVGNTPVDNFLKTQEFIYTIRKKAKMPKI